ncbi:DeoR/GlpR family DNA-binding transcription regulator [Oceanobacillus iheyensis]|uniref:Transcriptional regulator (DeoR family) n=1 Tax=Oceanobacillus iheyensis (strain DSM 14371 / CIP 107618 / JCM 11309 / KCTC 3954 / HTE831) TaxID=221109 RepID=Q8ESW8_OCEIH|nr:DeoR/GlpR family DNA-binding transcription regulator [Oceanobacillus iheyensis]BAC12454.1 transcriptional regulator (DeoR family) [Oceanobacillus iheyensis HTE831]
MLVAERHHKIVELVNEKKSIRVSDMSKLFAVTEETIRRDLEKLEKENKLARSHGGAVSLHPNDSLEIPYTQREIMNVREKQKIAMEAIKHVFEGDKIILDASTTAWYMAKALPDLPLTVMTNSIKVAMELSNKHQINVISTGGTLLSKSLSYAGPLAEASFHSYHLDKAFISCKGLHLERGISESDEQQSRIKKKMIESADSTYLMIDYSKFGKTAFSKIDQIEVAHHLVTDSKADQTMIQLLKEKGIRVTEVQNDE